MTFPVGRLGVRVRAVLTTFDPTADPSTWTWTDITPYVHHMRPIEDTIGASDDVSDSNTTLSFVIKNDDGRATTDNPASPWYPYFDIGTPIDYALDVGDGGGWDTQVVAYVDTVELEWPSGTQYRCLASVTCAGFFARGNDSRRAPVYSPMRRSIPAARARRGFWPLEDPEGTVAAASANPGGQPMVTYGGHNPFSFGAQSLLAGASSMATINAGQAMQGVLTTPTNGSSVRLSCVFMATQTPATSMDVFALYNTTAGGNRYVVEVGPSGLRLRVYNASSAEISGAGTIGFAAHLQGCVWFELDLTQNGANIDWSLREYLWAVDPNTGLPFNQAGAGSSSFAGTLGSIAAVTLAEFGDVSGITLGMVAVTDPPLPTAGGDASTIGWAGNTACSRVQGMGAEAGIPTSVTSSALGVLMGPQLIDTFQANMRDVAATDHGVLTDHLGRVDYRALSELYNLAPAFTLRRNVRGELARDLGAKRDSTAKANRVTLSRPGGSSVTVENAADQAARGVYDSSPAEANYATDAQLVAGAGWYLARGIATGQRHDGFVIDMVRAGAATSTLPGAVAALRLGDRIAIYPPPPQLAQNTITRQVRGRTQTVLNRGQQWTVAYTTVPVDAYQAFTLDETLLDTSGTELVVATSSTATTLVAATAGALPAVGSGLSIPLWAEGERVTLTAVATEAATDPYTRTVANGWGSFPATANIGAIAYTLSGTASNFAVTGTAATIAVQTAGSFQVALLQPLLMTDIDETAYCTVPVLAAGAALEVEISWRRKPDATAYALRLNIMPSAQVIAQVYEPGNSSPIVDNFNTGLTHTAGATYGMRVQTIGSRHMIYIWQGTTSAGRAPNPHIDVVSTARLTAGYCAWRNGRSSGNTNASPVTFSWDDLSFNNLQAFTVTRSVNSVVKALPANGKIRLWDGRGYGV